MCIRDSPSHTPLAIQALKAGKHVISEKPVSVSIEQAKQLKEAAAQTDKVFMAMPNDAYPQIEKVKELIEQGVIGEVCAIDSVFAHHGPLHAPWFFDYEKAQWGVLADLGVYSISTLSYLFGPVARVYGETRCFEKRRISDAGEEFIPSVEDNVAATLVSVSYTHLDVYKRQYQHKAKDKYPTVPSQAPFNLKRLIHASVFHTKYRQRMACMPPI